jgi:hypothetical protein
VINNAAIRGLVIAAMIAAFVISRVVRIVNSRKVDSIFRVSRIEFIVFFVCSGFMSATYALETKSLSVKIQTWISVAVFFTAATYLMNRILRDRTTNHDAKRPPDHP